jgi:hypothetical protein
LWPPNHALWTINANVQAVDLCGEVASIKLMSIVSNQPDNGMGDGDTTNDIQDASLNTLDLVFRLRAERAAPLGERRYTVTYRAADDSGNSADTSAVVIVPHDLRAYKEWLRMFGKFGSNVFPNQNWTIRKPNANPGARARQAGKAARQVAGLETLQSQPPQPKTNSRKRKVKKPRPRPPSGYVAESTR